MKGPFTLLLILTFALTAYAQNVDTLRVRVHGHELLLYVAGRGGPTVVVEAGGSPEYGSWLDLQPFVADNTRVVAYDRPGYMNSQPCSTGSDAVTLATELKKALLQAHILPPYVLLGWSGSSASMRAFAGLYPRKVAGLLLVNPAPEANTSLDLNPHCHLYTEGACHAQGQHAHFDTNGQRRAFGAGMDRCPQHQQQGCHPRQQRGAGLALHSAILEPADAQNSLWVESLEKWARKHPKLNCRIVIDQEQDPAQMDPYPVLQAVEELIGAYQEKQLKQAPTAYKKPEQLQDGLQTATLKEVGLNESLIKAMVDSISSGIYPNIHSVLLLRHNKLVFEQYYPGDDAVRGKGFVGFIPHHRDSLHDLRSVSKSVVAAGIMMALQQGKIRSLDVPVFDFFPEYARYKTAEKQHITLRHLLTMSSGLAWNEKISYLDPTNSETAMDAAPDPTAFVLSQPLAAKPGTTFLYSGGSTHLLAAILEKATGSRADLFVAEHLFKPLGINRYQWVQRRDGIPIAASGLRLSSRDMAKFGLLFLNRGQWQGEQILPEDLVAEAHQRQILTDYTSGQEREVGFSYQFWLPSYRVQEAGAHVLEAVGNGGQLILVDTSLNLVLVVTAGNYNQRDLKKGSYHLYTDFIYPAAAHGSSK